MKKSFLIIFSICLICISGTLKAYPKSNFDIIDSLTGVAAAKLVAFLKESGIETVKIETNSHPASWLFINHLVKNTEHSAIKVSRNDSSDLLVLNIFKLGMTYDNYAEDSDSLSRNFEILIFCQLGRNKTLKPIPELSLNYKDIIARTDLPFVQSTQHDFANSTVPPPPKSFFKELIEPFVVIGSAALVVILIFTVRSN